MVFKCCVIACGKTSEECRLHRLPDMDEEVGLVLNNFDLVISKALFHRISVCDYQMSVPKRIFLYNQSMFFVIVRTYRWTQRIRRYTSYGPENGIS